MRSGPVEAFSYHRVQGVSVGLRVSALERKWGLEQRAIKDT